MKMFSVYCIIIFLLLAGCLTITPLYWTAYFGLSKIAKQLVAAGADPSTKNSVGKTSFDFTLGKGHKDLIK